MFLAINVYFATLSADILNPDCPSTRLEMLVWIGKALDSHGLPWFVTYGTLLGAVRNGNILPWTADVDITIPFGLRNMAQAMSAQQLSDLRISLADAIAHNATAEARLLRLTLEDNDFHSFLATAKKCFDDTLAEDNQFSGAQNIFQLQSRGGQGIEHIREHWYWFASPVYVDVYNMLNWTDVFLDQYQREGRSLRGVYMVGSCQAEKKDKRLSRFAVFPINKTGVRIGDYNFPTPNIPEAFLDAEYGPLWCLPPEKKTAGMSGCTKEPNDFESQGVRRPQDLGPCDKWKIAKVDLNKREHEALEAVLADRQIQKSLLRPLVA